MSDNKRRFKLVVPSGFKVTVALQRNGYSYINSACKISEEIENEAHVPEMLKKLIRDTVCDFYAVRTTDKNASLSQINMVRETIENIYQIIVGISEKL